MVWWSNIHHPQYMRWYYSRGWENQGKLLTEWLMRRAIFPFSVASITISSLILNNWKSRKKWKKSLEKQKHLTVCNELGAHLRDIPGSMPPNPLSNCQFQSQQKMCIILSSRNKSCKVSNCLTQSMPKIILWQVIIWTSLFRIRFTTTLFMVFNHYSLESCNALTFYLQCKFLWDWVYVLRWPNHIFDLCWYKRKFMSESYSIAYFQIVSHTIYHKWCSIIAYIQVNKITYIAILSFLVVSNLP